MKFSIFKSAKAQVGEICTYEKYLEVANDPKLLELCKQIAAEEDHDKRSELKKRLPVITWQASFEGKRLAKEAMPSGLFMLDIDHIDNPFKMYSEVVTSRIKELGIVYVGKTASCHGLRIVAKCLPTLTTLADCQKWLASNLKVEYDDVCKDFARCSFLVHDSYTYYMDAKTIWNEEPTIGMLYAVGQNPVQVNEAFHNAIEEAKAEVDQREGLFGGQSDYNGIPLTDIAVEYLRRNGGEPHQGVRNVRLFQLALRMRYLTDFNEATLLRVLPDYGLPQSEMITLIRQAVNVQRRTEIPKDIMDVVKWFDKKKALVGDDNIDEEEIIVDVTEMPPLPPIIRQYVEVSPKDFKMAVALCQLPILGALGSKLRAQYLDGKMHSPSFQVSLEAPQASGKSFMRMLVDDELGQMIEHDNEQREKEREYEEKIKELKLLNIKINKDNKDDVLGTKPQSLIRFLPATISITKLLMRMNDAKGLHCFAFSEEIDTMHKAFKRSFSSLSDILRISFDNGMYGQDYASAESFSGNVQVFYNLLASGTPKAMRRFYPDVEDGLVSRVCFVTIPDQFGKPMPVWEPFTKEQREIMDRKLVELNEISIVGDEVQPDHVMKMDFLNKEIKKWIAQQQAAALRDNDRTRDIFCRRSAVVGFRAGMLAFFLYGEKNTPTIRKNVVRFAVWVANSMLNQHIMRFNIESNGSNIFKWSEVYNVLKDEFTREELQAELDRQNIETPVKNIIYNWKLVGVIEVAGETRKGTKNKVTSSKFKKVK